MATSGSGTSSPTAPLASGPITLAGILTRVRRKLDDLVGPDYGWDYDELTDDVNDLVIELCQEIPVLIEDCSTASVCQVAVAIGSSTLAVSPLILKIIRARLSSQDEDLPLRSASWMAANLPSWQTEENDEPTILITDGVGSGKVRLYAPSNAVDTLNLTVWRLPLANLVWDTDQNNAPEIPAQFHTRLINGLLAKSFGKQDTDTYDAKKEALFSTKWEADKEAIRRVMLAARRKTELLSLPKGLRGS